MPTLQQQLAACRAAVEAEAPRLVETMAQTRLALVTLRVQSMGLGVPYSTRRVPAYFFYNRALNAAGRDYVKQKSKQKNPKDRTGTWEEFKQAQGYGSASVNLTYSGRMFRSLTTLYQGFSGSIYRASIVAADQESANKVQWNTARYGDFLAPTAAEDAEVQQVGQQGLTRIIQQFFPG